MTGKMFLTYAKDKQKIQNNIHMLLPHFDLKKNYIYRDMHIKKD